MPASIAARRSCRGAPPKRWCASRRSPCRRATSGICVLYGTRHIRASRCTPGHRAHLPASFDEVARELTVAAARSGSTIDAAPEEPQAVHAWFAAHGRQAEASGSGDPDRRRRRRHDRLLLIASRTDGAPSASALPPSANASCSAATTWHRARSPVDARGCRPMCGRQRALADARDAVPDRHERLSRGRRRSTTVQVPGRRFTTRSGRGLARIWARAALLRAPRPVRTTVIARVA